MAGWADPKCNCRKPCVHDATGWAIPMGGQVAYEAERRQEALLEASMILADFCEDHGLEGPEFL